MSILDASLFCFVLACASSSPHVEAAGTGLGTSVSDEQVRSWNIDVRPDGQGLPAGRGSVGEGLAVYERACVACHGPGGRGGPMDALVGGQGTLGSPKPVKTVGSYWPYATTVFDFVNRAMPLDRPQSLTADEVYAVVAYLLFQNGILPPDAVLDAGVLPRVVMPNRSGFVADERPDVTSRR